MKERGQDRWETLSYEEGLPFVDKMFKRVMEIRRKWAEEAGKVIVFHRKNNDVFYNYKDKEVEVKA